MRNLFRFSLSMFLFGACAGDPGVTTTDTPLKQTKDGDPVYPDDPNTPSEPVCKQVNLVGHVYYNDLRDSGRFALRDTLPIPASNGFALVTFGRREPFGTADDMNYLGLLDATVELSEVDSVSFFKGCQPLSRIGEVIVNKNGSFMWSGQVCDSCRDDHEGEGDNGVSIAAKIILKNCASPGTRCFSVRDPDDSAPTNDAHFDDNWSGTIYERWFRGATVGAPAVIHTNATVDIGTDYFQASPTPTPGVITDMDAQAANVFASAVDVTRKLHVENTIPFGAGDNHVEIHFPDVKGWSHSHQDASNRVCVNAPGVRGNADNAPDDVPTEWFDGGDVAHEYGHLVHYWQWDGNGKWVSYSFDHDGDGHIDFVDEPIVPGGPGVDLNLDGDTHDVDESAERGDTRENTIAALKEGWAGFVEAFTFDRTGSPGGCDKVERAAPMECVGPAACEIGERYMFDVKHVLCDLADSTGNTEAGDTIALSIRVLTDTLAEVWDNHPVHAQEVMGAEPGSETTAPFGICDIARRIVNRGSATQTAVENALEQTLLDCNL
jgi:hypothetical protein